MPGLRSFPCARGRSRPRHGAAIPPRVPLRHRGDAHGSGPPATQDLRASPFTRGERGGFLAGLVLHAALRETFSPRTRRCLMRLQVPWLKPAVWGAVVGAVITMILGFSWMGWVLGGTAERLAVERANAAVVMALTPTCV